MTTPTPGSDAKLALRAAVVGSYDLELSDEESAEAFEIWKTMGLKFGWAGPPVCSTHDGIPTSEAEDEEFEEGDPCIHVMRLYESPEVKLAVEANHSPSVWRQ